jgi:hypothetical protein
MLTPSLGVSDLTPNVGMWWYFITEMFDHFRPFFLGVFHVSCFGQTQLMFSYISLCMSLRYVYGSDMIQSWQWSSSPAFSACGKAIRHWVIWRSGQVYLAASQTSSPVSETYDLR